jgi:hypothetical protein
MHVERLVGTALRWLRWWGVAGAVVGAGLMFTGTPIIAESGRGSHDPWLYLLWIPILAIVGGVTGAVTGALYAFVLPFSGPGPKSSRNARFILTGVTGILAGTLIGLAITRTPYALIISGLAMASGVATEVLDRRATDYLP